MPISIQELAELVEAGIITPDTANAIRKHQQAKVPGRALLEAVVATPTAPAPAVAAPTPAAAVPVQPPGMVPAAKFDFTHLLYYAGTLLVMGAMGWFMTDALGDQSSSRLAMLAVVYGVGFAYAGERLWQKPELRQPAGLLFTIAVWMVPLLTFALMLGAGLWPIDNIAGYDSYYEFIRPRFVVLELVTIAAAVFALKHRAIPFMMFPLAFAGWFLSMDLAALANGGEMDFALRRTVTALVGIALLLSGYSLQARRLGAFSFWLYLFGLLALWGVTAPEGPGSVPWVLLSVLCVVASLVLRRKTFMVFGGIGLHIWVGYLAFDIFRDSALFPLLLTAIGIGLIASGLWYVRHREELERRFGGVLDVPA